MSKKKKKNNLQNNTEVNTSTALLENEENIDEIDTSLDENSASDMENNTESLPNESETSKDEKIDSSGNNFEDFKKVNDEYVFSNDELAKKENNEDIENGISTTSSKELDKAFETKEKNKDSKKKIIIGVCIAFVILFALFLLFSTIFAIITSYETTIINGVCIKNIDISGLSRDQALEKISSPFAEKLTQEITLKHNNYEITVFPSQFEVSYDLEKAVDLAYSKGRSSNIFKNNFDVLVSLISGTKITPGFSYSEDTFNSLVTEMETNLVDRLIEPSYYIDGNNLILTKGKDGIVIDRNQLKTEIIYFINNLDCKTDTIEIPVISKKADSLDINKIHEEIYRAPQDAYYTTNPYSVYPHVDGIDFDISLEEAINIYNSSEESCQIPLKVLSPNVTTNQIGTEAFPNLLGTFSTTFSTRNTNRSTNIRLAAEKINGTVVMPGEIFSYNQTVGKRTAAAGFKEAGVYSGGTVTTGIGGGICQVSSTLYNSVLLANLEIIERYNHGFNPGYVPAGRDATVSWGGPDFKFKNSRNYPIKIDATVSGGTILIKIWGLKSDNEYDVEIQSYITSYIQYKTIERQDATLPKGTTKVIESGSSGCRSVCYRILKQNGEVISKTLLSNDTYSPHNRIVAVGTKQ